MPIRLNHPQRFTDYYSGWAANEHKVCTCTSCSVRVRLSVHNPIELARRFTITAIYERIHRGLSLDRYQLFCSYISNLNKASNFYDRPTVNAWVTGSNGFGCSAPWLQWFTVYWCFGTLYWSINNLTRLGESKAKEQKWTKRKATYNSQTYILSLNSRARYHK